MPNDFDPGASQDASGLVPMSQLDDLEVAEGYHDVRGWVVVGSDNRTLGSVRDLIVDSAALRTRYLDVQLEGSGAGSDGARSVLIPIGSANVNPVNEQVVLDATIVSRLASLPEYSHGQPSRDYEQRLLAALGTALPASGDLYAGRHFDDSRFVAGRDAAETRITSSEEERAISKRPIEAGEVEIDRHAIPADRAEKAELPRPVKDTPRDSEAGGP